MTFTQATELLRTALVAYLIQGDPSRSLEGLLNVLAADPDDSSAPALFAGTRSQAPPVFPSMTYRVGASSPDNQMRTGEAGMAGAVIRLRLEFEAWSGSADTAGVAAIAGTVEALLHNKGFSLGSGSRCFRTLLVTSQPDLFDRDTNAWYGLFAYELFIQLP